MNHLIIDLLSFENDESDWRGKPFSNPWFAVFVKSIAIFTIDYRKEKYAQIRLLFPLLSPGWYRKSP